MGSEPGTDAGRDRKPEKSGNNQTKGHGAGYRPEKEGLTMTGWQVQAMVEAAAMREWERINAPDPAESQMKEASQMIRSGLDQIDSGLDWLNDAAVILGDTPMEDKIRSFIDSFEALAVELGMLNRHYEKGERE